MIDDRRVRNEFDQLCREHREAALRIVRSKLGRRLRCRLDSQDVVQEAFMDAASLYEDQRDRMQGDGESFRNWLAAIIENKIRFLVRIHINAERRAVGREVSLDATGPDRIEAPNVRTPSSHLIGEERRESVLNALASLPPRQREVIQLVHLQGLEVREAAGRMGKTPGSTSVLLFRALERLGSVLKSGDPPSPAG